MLLTMFLQQETLGQSDVFYDSRDKVSISITIDPPHCAPGSDAVLAITLNHENGWHTHTNNPVVPAELGSPDDYIATQVHFKLPANSPITIHDGFIQWPEGKIVNVGFGSKPVDYAVFEEESTIFVPITISQNAVHGTAEFIIKTVFQACDDKICVRPTPTPKEGGIRWEEYGIQAEVEIDDLKAIGEKGEILKSTHFEGFRSDVWEKIKAGEMGTNDEVSFDAFGLKFSINATNPVGFGILLLVAMAGGFLLNLTPCVLPVIPIKIMGLSATAGGRKQTFILGVWMMIGVMSLWLLIGFAIAAISSFSAINQLFQYPQFTIGLGVFIAIMAIGMGGLFAIRLPNIIYTFNPKHDSPLGSFLFGNMTAILSTPCTAPFMGAAAAWGATQSPLITIIIFMAIGFGMGIPYLILAAFPQLVERMPRVGKASELIKQIMGLLMLAAAAYFIGVGLSGIYQEEGAPPSRIYLWAVVGCIVIAGIWLAIQMPKVTDKAGILRASFMGAGFGCSGIAILAGIQLTDKGPIDWVYYSPEKLQAEFDAGNITVVEFTAEWCLNCKLLENTVLNDLTIVEVFENENITPIKVDLTGNNKIGNDFLTSVAGLRIPLLIIYILGLSKKLPFCDGADSLKMF